MDRTTFAIFFLSALLLQSVVAMIDIGVNLTNKRFNGKTDQILKDAAAAGVTGIIITGTSLDSSRRAIQLIRETKETYGIVLKCTVGIHPHEASQFNQIKNLEKQLEQLIQTNRDIVVAVGESGLDYNRNFSPPDVQRDGFRKQMALAQKLSLPVFLHNREAHDDFITILREFPNVPKCVHCHTDPSLAHLQELVSIGAMIGQTGWITDERRGKDLRNIIPHIPPNRLMIETDSPFLLPQNIPDYRRKRYNEPAYLPFIVEDLARIYGRTEAEVKAKTVSNTKSFFNM